MDYVDSFNLSYANYKGNTLLVFYSYQFEVSVEDQPNESLVENEYKVVQ